MCTAPDRIRAAESRSLIFKRNWFGSRTVPWGMPKRLGESLRRRPRTTLYRRLLKQFVKESNLNCL